MIGGATYIATALAEPGLIVQTGTHRRIVFGEVFGVLPRLSGRVRELEQVLAGADIQAEAVDDGRVRIWEKFIFLATLAGFTGASRLPIGPLWADPQVRAQFLEGCREVERLARAEGIGIAADVIDRIEAYAAGIPGTMRSSLLIDLALGKRIEVEALQGAVVRRAAAAARARSDHVDVVCAAEALCRRGTPIRLSTASNRGCPCSARSPGSTPRNTHPPMWRSTMRSTWSRASSNRPTL